MKNIIVLLSSVLTLASCGKSGETAQTNTGLTISIDTNEEQAQNIGDVMASIDEAGGSTGTLGFSEPASTLVSTPISMSAVSCLGYGFGTCSANSMTRNFNGCTVGSSYTLTGTVGLTWTGGSANCTLGAAGDSIKRSPNFTITGPRGGTLAVTKTGTNGHVLTWTGGSAGASRTFSFTNDGINRKITYNGTTYYNTTTTTTSPITVIGDSRSNRTMSGGTLRLTNHLTGTTCDISPSNVDWSAGCACATSGTWSGSCGGTTFSVAITGCGTGTLTYGSSSQSITFDRCSN